MHQHAIACWLDIIDNCSSQHGSDCTAGMVWFVLLDATGSICHVLYLAPNFPTVADMLVNAGIVR